MGVMLDRVARFVRGDAEGGDRGAVVDALGQPEDLLARIVVVCQLTGVFSMVTSPAPAVWSSW